MEKTENNLRILAWGLSLGVSALALISWGDDINWKIGGISSYKLFPLFGLLAFGIMWAHYIMGAVRRYYGIPKDALKEFFEVTSVIVLLCILLHPGLLIWQLWRDGLGLPPLSYLENYVSDGARWAALLGSFSLLIFFSFELRRWFNQKFWWKYVEYASDVGMVFIFIHALRLGSQLQEGWFGVVWRIYGISLLGALAYTYMHKRNRKRGRN